MAKQTETRLFTGGIDANTAPFAMEQGSVLNAVNMRALLSEGQHTGELQALAGNEVLEDVLAGSILLGKEAAPERNSIFFFYYNAAGSFILLFDRTAGTVETIIDDAHVVGGLGFTADMEISAAVAGDSLSWVDGEGDTKHLDLTFDYMAGAASSAADITLVTEPPAVPLGVTRVATAGASSTIQRKSVQLTYRFTLSTGFVSVLAPYSETSFAARESELAADSEAGNSVTITVPTEQKIPSNWKYVELVALISGDPNYYVIKRWDSNNAADVAAVAAHNTAVTPLEFSAWSGVVREVLDAAYAAKLFDLVPRGAKVIENAANRLIHGNFREGYDTPGILPGFAVSPNAFTPTIPASVTISAYIASGKDDTVTDSDNYYKAVVCRISGKNYLLPEDMGSVHFTKSIDGDVDSTVTWALPKYIHLSALRELSDNGDPAFSSALPPTSGGPEENVRENLIRDAHGKEIVFAAIVNYMEVFHFGDFELIADASEFGPASESRAYPGGSEIKLGIKYYDAALRSAGTLPLDDVSIPVYAPLNNSLVESLQITLDNTIPGAIPQFAEYFSIVAAKNNRARRVNTFAPGVIKVAIKNSTTSEIEYGGFNYATTPPSGWDVYGIAFSLHGLTRYGIGYAYTEGDYIELAGKDSGGSNTVLLRGDVLQVHAGNVIMTLDNSLLADAWKIISDASLPTGDFGISIFLVTTPRRQDKVFATIFSGIQNDESYYEVAQFGKVLTSGSTKTFGHFFDSGTLVAEIFGDLHTHDRESSTGSFTGLGITTNEKGVPVPVSDFGRIAALDSIGERHLPNSIRYSNARIPGATANGYSSFDALDIKTVDETAGPITAMILTTRGAQDGGQLLVLCTNGSFTALVGQQQLADASRSTGLTVAANVLGDFNPLKGGYGCISPRSVVRHQSRVWWVDVFNREIIEFGDAGARSIASFKASRLFQQLLTAIADTGNAAHVSCGVNPLAREFMVSFPETSADPLPSLATVPDLINPFDSFTNKPATYCFNYEDNKWQFVYESGAEFISLGNSVFSWDHESGKLYREFVAETGTYYGVEKAALIAVPFNAGYPAVKSLRTLSLVSDRVPDKTWVMCEEGGVQHVAGVQAWQLRDGAWMAAIRRDRTSNGATTPTEWNQSGVTGKNLKGRVAFVVMIWNAGGSAVNASSLSTEWAPALGQTKGS